MNVRLDRQPERSRSCPGNGTRSKRSCNIFGTGDFDACHKFANTWKLRLLEESVMEGESALPSVLTTRHAESMTVRNVIRVRKIRVRKFCALKTFSLAKFSARRPCRSYWTQTRVLMALKSGGHGGWGPLSPEIRFTSLASIPWAD